MAFHEHLPHEITFQPFAEEQQQQQLGQSRDMQRLLPLSGGAPTWLNNSNAATLRQQNFLHLQPESAATTQQNDDVRGGGGSGMDRNRTESNSEPDDLAEYKADILGHPLYDQLLSAHVSCLRIATPVDQLPRIDAQLQQSQRVVDKYSGIGNGNGVVDDKELDQFMVCSCFLSDNLNFKLR